MAKVICTLENASSLINGINFMKHELGVISEEISDEAAAALTKIKGYVLHEEKVAVEDVETPLAELFEKAQELGIRFDQRWGVKRLKKEILVAEDLVKQRAEKLAQDAAAEVGAAVKKLEGANATIKQVAADKAAITGAPSEAEVKAAPPPEAKPADQTPPPGDAPKTADQASQAGAPA